MVSLEFNGLGAGEIKSHPAAMARWMIRFAKTAVSGVRQLFLVRKAITSGKFSC